MTEHSGTNPNPETPHPAPPPPEPDLTSIQWKGSEKPGTTRRVEIEWRD